MQKNYQQQIENLQKRAIELYHNPHNIGLPTDIPTDPDEFYQDFGLLEHPLTKLPVQHLTAYQYAVWKDGQRHRYREVIKSQKVGITTSSLIEDFQKAITTCKGKEILVIAQDTDHAKDHLYTLRKLISNSKKYSKFLINKSIEEQMRLNKYVYK